VRRVHLKNLYVMCVIPTSWNRPGLVKHAKRAAGRYRILGSSRSKMDSCACGCMESDICPDEGGSLCSIARAPILVYKVYVMMK